MAQRISCLLLLLQLLLRMLHLLLRCLLVCPPLCFQLRCHVLRHDIITELCQLCGRFCTCCSRQ